MHDSVDLCRRSKKLRARHHYRLCIFFLLSFGATQLRAQATSAGTNLHDVKASYSIAGVVLDENQKPANRALVRLTSGEDNFLVMEVKTDATGVFRFPPSNGGRYAIHAELGERRSQAVAVTLPQGSGQPLKLMLQPAPSSAQTMEFADQPNFTVAGVTDWTAVGGHGSDSSLRTSEDLARQTLALKPTQDGTPLSRLTEAEKEKQARLLVAREKKPKDFSLNHELGHSYLVSGLYKEAIQPLQTAYDSQPANSPNEYDLARAFEGAGEYAEALAHVQMLLRRGESADLHRMAGELDEKLGNPLAAVQEEQKAVQMEPSEQNYFALGSELLLHRAVREAVTVLRAGLEANPKSARILTALGAALFASASYAEAASRLCDASDLDPTADQPYLFLGKVGAAAPSPLPCVEERLARFARLQPGNGYANYLYAMAIWKRQEVAGASKDPQVTKQVEDLLMKAVSADGKCSEAYLQLGIIYADRHAYDQAAAYYLRATQDDPKLSEAHYRLGVAYDRLGEHEKARQEFQMHDAIEKEQTAEVQRQRREVKQFQIEPATPAPVVQ